MSRPSPTHSSSIVTQSTLHRMTPSKPTTCVNGTGMYHSWKRNFKSPFFAMLDIVDNAIDAGFDESDTFHAKIDVHQEDIAITNDDDDGGDDDGNNHGKKRKKGGGEKRHELIIVNNSRKEISPLSEILEVYKSNKGAANNDLSDHIGQNGVGE